MSMSGFLFPGVLEFVDGVGFNDSVLLLVGGDGFYANVSNCSVVVDNFTCGVGLRRKAVDFRVLWLNESVFLVNFSSGGVLQSPLFCFGWSSPRVINVRMDVLLS